MTSGVGQIKVCPCQITTKELEKGQNYRGVRALAPAVMTVITPLVQRAAEADKHPEKDYLTCIYLCI